MRPRLLFNAAWRAVGLICSATALLVVSPAAAQTKRAEKDKPAHEKGPTDFRSQNFVIHTDLTADEAKDLLERLETMLGLISAYWAHAPSGIIECYVVKDLTNFLKHLEQGYRADLCSWDWKWKKWRALKGSTTVTAKLKADRGWQPAGVLVTEAAQYQYKATGTWRLAKDGPELSADGADEGGAGQLLAVVLSTLEKEKQQEYALGEEFELGAEGTFTAPAAGQLFLRCRDAWGQLADNQGTVTVKLKARGKK